MTHIHEFERGSHMREAFGVDGRRMACAICGEAPSALRQTREKRRIVWLDDQTWADLGRTADSHRVTRSSVIRYLVAEDANDCEVGRAPRPRA